MPKLNINDADVMVVTDLYLAGKTEDGEDYNAECYYVVVERRDGKRLAHSTVWNGCETGDTPSCPEEGDAGGDAYFADIRKEAKAEAETLALRVEEVGVIDDAHWVELEPSYGSEYYCKVNGL